MSKLMNAYYMGKVTLVDSNGQAVNARVVQKDVPKNYWKVNVEDLIKNMGNMTPKSMVVIDYVLRHTDYHDNKFIGTNKDISKHIDVGYAKIANTLSFLTTHHIINRHRRGVIMWNPDIINHQAKAKVPDLLIQYRVNDGSYRVVKHSSKADVKRTAKARRVKANKHHKSNKKLKIYATKSDAKRHNGFYQEDMLKLNKNKKAS